MSGRSLWTRPEVGIEGWGWRGLGLAPCSMLNRIVGCKTGRIYCIQSYPTLYVCNVHESSTREEKSAPSHYTGKVWAHTSVLACLTLYLPPCLCAKHVQTTSKFTESARRVHLHSLSLSKQVSRAFFAMRICTYVYQFHLCIIQHTRALH